MYSTFSDLKGLFKIRAIITDNAVFQLHYRLTSLMLLAFSIVVTATQYFGNPISCFTSRDEVPNNVLNNYCWIHSTYTIPSSLNKRVGSEVIYPGIDKSTPTQDKNYHSYYQWVCFFLFFQGVLFYLPRYLWKLLEGSRIAKIIIGLDKPMIDPPVKDKKVYDLSVYLQEIQGTNTCYGIGYLVCEALNFANVIGQMYFTNTFLGGEFTTYGTEVVEFAQTNQINRTDPMIEVFPRVTKCTFYKYGAAGNVQYHDALCILPINIVNEKIFIVLWFWYIILAIVSGLVIIYRIVLICSQKVREHIMLTRCRYADDKKVRYINSELSYGDWFLWHNLQKNMAYMHFCQLIDVYSDMLQSSASEPKLKLLKQSDYY